MTTETKTKKKTTRKRKTKTSNLFFITSAKCGWCTKAEPVVEELRKEGYVITALDMTVEEEAKKANEIKQKHGAQCGTPLFIDSETGNSACGYKEKDVLMKWANGEEIPKPAPRPQNNQAQAQGSNVQVIEGDILPELLQPYKLYAGKSKTVKGYGVFAADNISAGELSEESIFFRSQYRDKDLVHPEIRQMLYTLPCQCEVCKHRGNNFVIAGGFIQTYNHDGNPNVKFEFLKNNRIIRVYAIKDIPEGTELFHNYGNNYGNFQGVQM